MDATIIDNTLKSSVRIVLVTIARYREDHPRSERPLISSAGPGRASTPWGPKKPLTFSWWNVKMHYIQRQCCILTKFMLLIKYTCDFFPSTDMFLSREQIYLRWHRVIERKFDVRLLTDVSSSACRIKTVGLIFIQSTGNDQLHVSYTSTKIYANHDDVIKLKHFPRYLPFVRGIHL